MTTTMTADPIPEPATKTLEVKDPHDLLMEAFGHRDARDAANTIAEEVMTSISGQITTINTNRSKVRQHSVEIQRIISNAIDLNSENVARRMKTLRHTRKGIPLERLDFFDPRAYMFGSSSPTKPLLWFGFWFTRNINKTQYDRNDIFCYCGIPETRLQSMLGAEAATAKEPMSPRHLQDLRQGILLTSYRPYRMCFTNGDIDSHPTQNTFNDIRAFEISSFDDIPRFTVDELEAATRLLSNPTNGYTVKHSQ
jgi:hypothetical protein